MADHLESSAIGKDYHRALPWYPSRWHLQHRSHLPWYPSRAAMMT
jgi:hypothetical protein